MSNVVDKRQSYEPSYRVNAGKKPSASRSWVIFGIVFLILAALIILACSTVAVFVCYTMYSDRPITQTPVSDAQVSADNLAYVSVVNGGISIVDVNSSAIIGRIQAVKSPGRTELNKQGTVLYVSDGRYISVIEVSRGTKIKEIGLTEGIANMVMSPDGGRLYVNTEENDNPGTVHVIDTNTDAVVATIKDVPFSWGMAISPDGKRLYLSDYFEDRLTVIDTENSQIIGAVRCSPPDQYTSWGNWKGHAYWTCGQAADVEVSPDGKYVYVSVWGSRYSSVIDAKSLTLEKQIDMGGRSSSGVAVSQDGKYVYFSCYDSNSVLKVDTATNNVVTTASVSSKPRSIVLTPDGGRLYVFPENGAVQVIDTNTMRVTDNLGIVGTWASFTR